MNIKTLLAVFFALIVGIGGTAAYFYLDRLENAWNAPPVPPVRVETQKVIEEPPENIAPPAHDKHSKHSVEKVSVANAGALKNEDLAIGGISYGASVNDVRATHGEPFKVENKRKWRGHIAATVYVYPGLFDLYVVDGIVRCIKVEHLNNLNTKRDIGVGASINDVLAAYGEPNLRDNDHFVYYVEGNVALGIDFEIDHGFVEEIRVGMLK